MIRRTRSWKLALATLAACFAAPLFAQDGGAGRPESLEAPPVEGSSLPGAVPRVEREPEAVIASRLEALHPDRPVEYFLLAEEVADIAIGPRSAQLAQRLYVLAFELALAAGDRPTASSAVLGLGATTRLDERRRTLAALARSIDPRHARPNWSPAIDSVSDGKTAYDAATALGLVRSGYGRAGMRLLREPGVRPLLVAFDALLSPVGATGAFAEVERQAPMWPCPECANELVVPVPGSRPPDRRACSTCLGAPGPRLSHEAFLGHLRLELRLLDGIGRSWAAQVASDRGAPLLDPEADEVAPMFGIDPSRTIFRDGQWIRPQPSPDAEPAPPAAPEPDSEPNPQPASGGGASGGTSAGS
ncbi:MAG: hypothetical protein EA378_11195 [Phycisphaerales bacterium]|nr:MAG: hypothetical protein EA378_11195 [Phycisphaerales bacterium]